MSVVCLNVHTYPLYFGQSSGRHLFVTSLARLVAVLRFDEPFLLVNPELDLGIAGVTALVAKLHGGPVVVCSSLKRERQQQKVRRG